MDELKEIYDRMTLLRQKGVKMKEMAEKAGFAPSVLSAVYSTVLPAYPENRAKGQEPDEALGGALVRVNNVSKKKLLGPVAALKDALYSAGFHSPAAPAGGHNPFWPNWRRISGKPPGASSTLRAPT